MSSVTSTSKCSPKPILKSLTQSFLDTFGTETIPEGYVEGDGYGKGTKEQDFAELLTVFYILLIITALIILVFLMMILFLVWYFKRCKSDPKKCKRLKFLSLLLIVLLLILLLFLAFALFVAFKNSWDLTKKVIGKGKGKSVLDVRNAEIMNQVNEVLVSNYANFKQDCLSKYNESDGTTISFPQTEGICLYSRNNADTFDDFIVDAIESEFENILLYDDALRMFSRNFSSFLGVSPVGKQFVEDLKSTRHFDYVFSLQDWTDLYQAAEAISMLMHYYGNVRIDPITSQDMKAQIYKYVEDYLNERERDAKALSQQIEGTLNLLTRKRGNPPFGSTAYNFGFVMCIVSIVILIIYLIILMCSLCKKRNRNRAMIKPLIIIFSMLTLLFILMAFVTIYHFFYGVVEYNGICGRGGQSQSAEDTHSFYSIMLKKCTNNQKIYSLMTENQLLRPMSKWPTLTASGVKTMCNITCTSIDLNFIKKKLATAELFPSQTFCDHFKPGDKPTPWLNTMETSMETYKTTGYKGIGTLINQPSDQFYYWSRLNMSACNLEMAKDMLATFNIPEPFQKLRQCKEGYNRAREFLSLVSKSLNETDEQCQKLRDTCTSFIEDITTVKRKVGAYILNAENKLNNNIGPCATILGLATNKLNEFCNCESYILNGVWVGGLLFLLGLLLTLLLLPCLICLFIKCDDLDYVCRSRRPDGRRDHAGEPRRRSTGRRRGSAESIVLPPISLPRAAIDMIRANPDVQVRYLVKKKMK